MTAAQGEVAHAAFSMLKVPILGCEEDAADQVAAYLLLQLDKDEARRTSTKPITERRSMG